MVECPPAPPLGVRPNRAVYEEHSVALPNGSTLVLYTDGLIEDRHRSLDEGLQQLMETLRTTGDEPLEQQCERAVALMVDAPQDDVCLLLARRVDMQVAAIELEAETTASQIARRFIRDRLAEWELSRLEADATLVASELVTNAVRYAQSGSRLVLRRIEGGVRLELTDEDAAMPELQEPSLTRVGGRGLQVVASVATRWGVDAGGAGKTVWAELTR